MEKETLEEAAYQARRNYQDEVGKDGMNECIMFDAMKIQKGFELGAKWQAKRMYSEEEVLEHLNHLIMMSSSELDKFTDDKEMITVKWFEQFKKK